MVDEVELAAESLELGMRLQRKREAVFGIELDEAAVEHLADLFGFGLRLVQRLAQAVAQRREGLLATERERAAGACAQAARSSWARITP